MTHDPSNDVDRRLREAFEPGPPVIARVVAGAAAACAPRRHRRRQRLRLAWVGLAVLTVASGTAYWRSSPALAPEGERGIALSGSFAGEVFVVGAPDGSVSLFGPGTRDERPPEGFGIVVVEGGVR